MNKDEGAGCGDRSEGDRINGLTRYPEEAIAKGTSVDDNTQAFSDIISRQGGPNSLNSDNSGPFNGKDSHPLQKDLRSMGVTTPTRAPRTPRPRGSGRPS